MNVYVLLDALLKFHSKDKVKYFFEEKTKRHPVQLESFAELDAIVSEFKNIHIFDLIDACYKRLQRDNLLNIDENKLCSLTVEGMVFEGYVNKYAKENKMEELKSSLWVAQKIQGRLTWILAISSLLMVLITIFANRDGLYKIFHHCYCHCQ